MPFLNLLAIRGVGVPFPKNGNPFFRVLAFLGTGNPLSILSSRVPVNANPNLTPPGNLIELGIDIRAFYTSVTPSAEETLFV
jgi:hypothetical protein